MVAEKWDVDKSGEFLSGRVKNVWGKVQSRKGMEEQEICNARYYSGWEWQWGQILYCWMFAVLFN